MLRLPSVSLLLGRQHHHLAVQVPQQGRDAVVSLHMDLDIVFSGKTFPTHSTLERLQSGVNFLVLLQLNLLRKPPVALFTLEDGLTRVSLFVKSQVSLTSKTFNTVGTFKRSLARVRSQVDLQLTVSHAFLPTELAFEQFPRSMHHFLVILQNGQRVTNRVALRTDEHFLEN